MLQQENWVLNRPVGELLRVAQVAKVVDVAEKLVLELRVADDWYRQIRISRHSVTFQARNEVANVRRYLLDEHPTHFRTPNHFRRIELAEKDFGKLFGRVILQEAHHCFGKHLTENTSMHDVGGEGVIAAERLLHVGHLQELHDG